MCHPLPSTSQFWHRELRIDLAVSDSERSPLSLNLFTKEAQTSWLRLFKRKGDHLDVTVDESTRANHANKFMEENKETKTNYTTKSEAKQQMRTLTRAVKTEEVRACAKASGRIAMYNVDSVRSLSLTPTD